MSAFMCPSRAKVVAFSYDSPKDGGEGARYVRLKKNTAWRTVYTLGVRFMHPYALLGFAIFTEVIGTVALKVSDGMTKLGPAALVVGGYGLSFWLLSLTLATMPVGLVYAIWSGIGIAAIALIGQYFFGEVLTLGSVVGLVLIVAGIAVLQMSGTSA